MKTTNGPSAPKSRRETVTKDGNSKDKGQLKRKSDENDRNGDKRSRPNASESTKKDKQTGKSHPLESVCSVESLMHAH